MKFHENDRAQRLMDIFPWLPGQINVHYFNSIEHVTAWHRHKIQTDYIICLQGSFKVGMSDGNNVWWEYLSDKNFRKLEISPPIWHGYRALEPNSILLYYLTEKYNSDDIEKVIPGYFGEDWR